MIFRRQQAGFSLVELSIVILIMGLLLGGLMMPLSVQRENARLRAGLRQLESITDTIAGFALANGYLPCPATPASGGYAAPSGSACVVQHGFVPATTLDLSGQRNGDNLLLDPWGSAVRYSVSASDANADGRWDFVTPGEMRQVTMAALSPDLVVCSSAAGSAATGCATPQLTLAARAPMIVYSLGKDWPSFTSPDQLENVGATLGGGSSGINYRVAADNVFVLHGKSDLGAREFDDLVVWMAPNRLYARLADAGFLP